MNDISPRDEEKIEQISQISQLTIPSQQKVPITTQSKFKTLLGVLVWSSIMLVLSIIAFQTNLRDQLTGKFSHYSRNELVNETCDPNGQFTKNSGNNRILYFRSLQTNQPYEDDEQEIYQQEYQQQQTQYQANQTTNSTFNQSQSDEYYHQYNNSNITFEQFAQCYASLTQVGVYLQYQLTYEKINALFYVSIGVSLVTFAGFLYLQNQILNKISSLLFVLSHSLTVAGITLIYEQVNGGLQPVIAVCLLILIDLILIMIMDLRKCAKKTQFTIIFIVTPLILLPEGPLKFEIESIPIALMFSTCVILMNGRESHFTSSIKIFGLIYYLLFNALSKIFLDPISKLRQFSLREHILPKTTDDNKRIHLIQSYMNVLGILILMYIIWILTYNTQFINLFAKKHRYTFFVYTTDTPMMIASYVIPGTLHLISTMMYQNTKLTKAKYALIYLFVIIEWIFLALLIGTLTTIEITHNIFIMDNKSIEYFLVLSMIGVIGLISNVDFKYQQIMIPVSSINMIAYYFDYRSICIGLASSLAFCYYISKYSEYLISEQNKTIEIAIEDDFITTNCLVNPIQLLSHIIQSIINKYKSKEVVGYTITHNVDHENIRVQKAEIELIQQ